MTQATLNVPKALDALENLHGYLLGKDDLYANGALREFCEEALSAISAEDWRGKRHPLSPGDAGMPPRDPTKTNEQQGLYGKYIVRRTDGSDAPGGKHHGCDYFVLDVTHDRHAKAALAAYADAAESTHPLLAADMRARWWLTAGDAGMPVVAPLDVFSHGPWTYQETGQSFTGAELNAEAFNKYAAAIAARDARVTELERTLAETGGGARASTDTQRIEWMFLNCQDKSAEDLEFENPDAWREWVDAAMDRDPVSIDEDLRGKP